jgi:multiple sugar transport system permease protein
VFQAEGLDPEKGPADWDLLRDVALRLTRRRDPGYERVGFLPLFGNSWLYLFGWLAGGEPVRFGQDGTKVRCVLNEPPWVQALEYLTATYRELGGQERLDAWLQEANGTGAQQAMLTGKLAMVINTDNWGGVNFGRYAPDLDFTIALPPAPKGRQPLTWSGIWNMVVLKQTKLPDEATEFIAFVTAVDGLRAWAHGALNDFRATSAVTGGYWYPAVATNRPGGAAIYELAKGQMSERGQKLRRFSQDALQTSKTRPVMPSGLEIWDAQANAATEALAGKGTPKALLDTYTEIANARLREVGVSF